MLRDSKEVVESKIVSKAYKEENSRGARREEEAEVKRRRQENE